MPAIQVNMIQHAGGLAEIARIVGPAGVLQHILDVGRGVTA